jgi:hypothetical protein
LNEKALERRASLEDQLTGSLMTMRRRPVEQLRDGTRMKAPSWWGGDDDATALSEIALRERAGA